MIPYRVKLAGFLSYQDEQEITFAGAPIWMLTGANGSGKSAIFDAVTYALFGQHRGGSQNAEELINKVSTGLAVDFDFHLEGVLHRIKRTLRRGKKGSVSGTQQVFVQRDIDWEAVPDTNKKGDFDRWIAAHIGLSYDIFTSSVLLLQGKAEKLLDSKPTGRAEVLAGIVDLERYQRLYERANKEKLKLKARLEEISHQSAGVPSISDADYSAALIGIDDCERGRTAAQEAIRAAAERLAQAQRWAEAEGRSAAARERLRRGESLLKEADAIQKAHRRLTELRQVLPAVEVVVTTRVKAKAATEKMNKLNAEKEETIARKAKTEADLDRQKRERTLDKRRLDDDEAMYAALVTQLRTLAAHLQTVRQLEDEESKRKRYAEELAQLPPDPDGDLANARAELERLTLLDRVLPILERVQTERHDLAQANLAQVESQVQLKKLADAGAKAKAEAAKAKAELDAARTGRTDAESAAAVAQAQLERAKAALAEFQKLKGQADCSACGQPLTPDHYSEELRKRTDEQAQAAAAQKKAVAALKTAVKREDAAATAEAQQAEQLVKLREEYKTRDAAAGQAARDIKRLTDSLDLRYAEMPDPYRLRIAPEPPTNWAATTFPERDVLVNLRRESAGFPLARQQVSAADEMLKRASEIRTRLDAATQSRDRLKAALPDADAVQLRAQHATAQSQDTVLVNRIKAGKAALEKLDRAIDKLAAEAANEAQRLTEWSGKLHAEKLALTHCGETIDRALQNLPEAWQALTKEAGLEQNDRWKSELGDLVEGGTEERFGQLEQSRLGLDGLRADVQRLEAEAAAFPDESRRPLAELQAEARAAQEEFERHDAALQVAMKAKLKLDAHREQRDRFARDYKEVDGIHNRYKILAELLGRDRLQRHLVRRAERQIVEFANAVLDRLSSGQLCLKLAGSEDGSLDKALELDCINRITGGDAIGVSFLSGSQKFRVAVSLALGIGQYASRQHRPIESVIIDEGFGSLDREGRQVMIQELQNLRGQLKCILLVSHQEEFAEAFADGYRFELHDGATRVSRIHR